MRPFIELFAPFLWLCVALCAGLFGVGMFTLSGACSWDAIVDAMRKLEFKYKEWRQV